MINLLSLNIRGLNNDHKITSLFSLLKADLRFKKFDIILLHETKLHRKDHTFFQNRWNSHVIFSSSPHGGNAGTLILIRKHSNIHIISSWADDEGRISQLVFSWLDLEFTLFSVYAPAEHATRTAFFDKFLDKIPETESALVLMGGDFNCVADPVLDRSGGDPVGGQVGFPELQEIMSALDLEDIWRVRHPTDRAFTWASSKTQNDRLVRSRIDRWLSSALLSPFIRDASIFDFPLQNLDHKAVTISIADPDMVKPGPGYWKLNTSLLEDHNYRYLIRNELRALLAFKPTYNNPMQWWEMSKKTIKEVSEKFAKKKAARLARKGLSLQEKLSQAESLLASNPSSPTLQSAFINAKNDLSDYEKYKLDGLLLRSRSTFVAAQETPSRAIKMISQVSQKSSQIPSLSHPTLGPSSDPHVMLITATEFYSNLFKEPPSGPAVSLAQTQILSSWTDDILTDGDPRCDGLISLREAKEAIFSSPKFKSPGIDGLPVEFYAEFWDILGPAITQMFNDILDYGLTESQSRAVISLIFKKGDPLDVANYRPISVLCHDIKALARVLVKRLHKVVDLLIFPDQTGVKGRFIGESTRQFLDTFEYLHSANMSGIILLLDQAKAFDMVSWSFLHKVLEHVGLSPPFRKWIQRLYENPSASIKINNYISLPFTLHCGVRQGCPLSPILFCLCIEALARSLRADPLIKGISLPGDSPGYRSLTALYMDDTQLHLADFNDLVRAKAHCLLYCTASNASFNWSKSEGILVGLPQPPFDPLFNLKWLQPDEEFKILGLKLKNSFPLDLSVPWSGILEKVTNRLKMGSWNFSLKGRVTFVKTYIVSLIPYLANSVPLPASFAVRLDKLIWRYIWKGASSGKVRREVMSLPASLGGLGVPSVSSTVKSIQAKWIVRLLSLHPLYHRPWAALAVHFLQNFYCDWGLGLHFLLFKPSIGSSNYLPPFWLEAVRVWWSALDPPQFESFSKEDILSFPLFLNPVLQRNGRPLQQSSWRVWTSYGICRIRDIWNDGLWMSPESILRDYGLVVSQSKLDSLIATIPGDWKNKLAAPWPHSSGYWALHLGGKYDIYKVVIHASHGSFALEYFGPLPLPEGALDSGPLVDISQLEYLRPVWLLNDSIVFKDLQITLPSRISVASSSLSKFSLKSFRDRIIPIAVPPATIIYNGLVQSTIPWGKVWKNVWKPMVPRNFNQTYFLFLHRGLPHGERAYKYDLNYPDWFCPHCRKLESLMHIFWDCPLASHCWSWLKRTWKNSTGLAPPVSWFWVVTGSCHLPSTLSRFKPFLSTLHRTILHTLWRARCDLHHGSGVNRAELTNLIMTSYSNTIASWKYTRLNHLYLLARSQNIDTL
jgi:exonuclease III